MPIKHQLGNPTCYLILCFLAACKPCLAQLVINEFLADPAGADAGREFVELLNTGPEAINLLGVEFQFANGSVDADWDTRWRMETDWPLAPGEIFLLVDRNWQGEAVPQGQVWLGLQNGPDAIRLFWQGAVLDLVGYGSLTDPEMFEGEAVPLVSGLSLARRPDGWDTNNNLIDFVSASSTPGEANFNDYELRVESFGTEPPSLAQVGENLWLTVVLKNVGLLDIPTTELQVQLRSAEGESQTVLETLFAGCRSQEQCQVFLGFAPGRIGRFSVSLEFNLPAENALLNIQVGKLQVGAGEIYLSEVLSAPPNHQGEWVEVQAGAESVNLGQFKLRDEEGAWKDLPPVDLAPGEFLVVAQDSAALAQWHLENLVQGMVLDCPPGQLTESLRQMPGTWPSLNNNPPEDRSFADRVYLGDAFGTVLDHVTLPASNRLPDGPGLSWERMSHFPESPGWGDWRSCTAPQGGTPGCTNSVGDILNFGVDLSAEPPLLDSSLGIWVTHIRFVLTDDESNWHVEVFDLWGAMVRDLGGTASGPGTRDLIWDGKDDQGYRVPVGGYVVLLHKSRNNQSYRPVAKTLVVVR